MTPSRSGGRDWRKIRIINRKDRIMTITRNLATWDRAGRFILGVLLIGLAATGTLGPWAWIGVIPLATAFMNFCPLYRVFGFKTCTDC